MTPEVHQTIEEIRATFPKCPLSVQEDGEGGARVVIENVPLGGPFAQESTWVGFQVTFQYPYADVYPHYVRGDLSRSDGGPLGAALSPTTWQDRQAIQVSRKSNQHDAGIDTACTKLLKVLTWLRSRP